MVEEALLLKEEGILAKLCRRSCVLAAFAVIFAGVAAFGDSVVKPFTVAGASASDAANRLALKAKGAQHAPMAEKAPPTKDERVLRKLRTRFWVVVVFAAIVAGVAAFGESMIKLFKTAKEAREAVRKPDVQMTVSPEHSGAAKLTFTFTDVSKGFTVDKVRLQFSDLRAAPAAENPSKQIEVLHYDAQIPESIIESETPVLDVPTAAYHNPAEPFARLDVTLAWERPASTLLGKVTASFLDAKGTPIKVSRPLTPADFKIEHRKASEAVQNTPKR